MRSILGVVLDRPMAVTHVAYEVEGWGVGELWLEGARVVWHDLPFPRPDGPG